MPKSSRRRSNSSCHHIARLLDEQLDASPSKTMWITDASVHIGLFQNRADSFSVKSDPHLLGAARSIPFKPEDMEMVDSQGVRGCSHCVDAPIYPVPNGCIPSLMGALRTVLQFSSRPAWIPVPGPICKSRHQGRYTAFNDSPLYTSQSRQGRIEPKPAFSMEQLRTIC